MIPTQTIGATIGQGFGAAPAWGGNVIGNQTIGASAWGGQVLGGGVQQVAAPAFAQAAPMQGTIQQVERRVLVSLVVQFIFTESSIFHFKPSRVCFIRVVFSY